MAGELACKKHLKDVHLATSCHPTTLPLPLNIVFPPLKVILHISTLLVLNVSGLCIFGLGPVALGGDEIFINLQNALRSMDI